ncbi:MAG: PfkB family carbohydrate kinase [Paracoccaceae bacterium]
MTGKPEVVCIGSVLWDVIGRASVVMQRGSDMPGRITRLPGGVALNIAMTLAQFGMTPAVLTSVGRDTEGDELITACADLGLITDFAYRSEDLPTDVYMAVEGANGLIAAIADAHSLEAAGDKILRPLLDGRLATKDAPYTGLVALDGNLTIDLLSEIAASPAFANADLRVAPASPGKADRLMPFLGTGRGTVYVNLEEAGTLCQCRFDTSAQAATTLVEKGAARAIVTDGAQPASEADRSSVVTLSPPNIAVHRVTGAGDTFMAAHIAAEHRGCARNDALQNALDAAAIYVSGGTPT